MVVRIHMKIYGKRLPEAMILAGIRLEEDRQVQAGRAARRRSRNRNGLIPTEIR